VVKCEKVVMNLAEACGFHHLFFACFHCQIERWSK